MMRKAISRLLQEEPEIEIVAESEDFAQTLIQIHRFEPQVVIFDLHMPSGSSLPESVVRQSLQTAVAKKLAISIWNDDEARTLAESFGASAFLDKMKLTEELIPAVMGLAGSSSDGPAATDA